MGTLQDALAAAEHEPSLNALRRVQVCTRSLAEQYHIVTFGDAGIDANARHAVLHLLGRAATLAEHCTDAEIRRHIAVARQLVVQQPTELLDVQTIVEEMELFGDREEEDDDEASS